jgi:uncharacterized protein (DUF2384 family)
MNVTKPTTLLDDLSEGNVLSPVRISLRLGLTLTELAQLAGMHPNSLSQNPAAPSVQKGLQPIAHILSAAEELAGAADDAIFWFRHEPIPAFGGRTPIELVEQGQAAAVLAHIQALRDGSYA